MYKLIQKYSEQYKKLGVLWNTNEKKNLTLSLFEL